MRRFSFWKCKANFLGYITNKANTKHPDFWLAEKLTHINKSQKPSVYSLFVWHTLKLLTNSCLYQFFFVRTAIPFGFCLFMYSNFFLLYLLLFDSTSMQSLKKKNEFKKFVEIEICYVLLMTMSMHVEHTITT